MQTIVDYLQQLARGRTSGASPLVAVREFAATNGQRVPHLPLLPVLAQAWTTLTSEPFRPHQAAAVAVTRRGDPLALMADDPLIGLTASLMLYDALIADPQARALCLLPDGEAVAAQERLLAGIDPLVPGAPSRVVLDGAAPLRGRLPRLLLTTPELLHGHLLRFHDRAWRGLWSGLGVVLLGDAHAYSGVSAACLGGLLLRLYRVAEAAGGSPRLLLTLARVGEPAPAVEALTGGVYRVLSGDDGPRHPASLVVWRAGADRLKASGNLAAALHAEGYSVAIAAHPAELAPLRQALGDLAAFGNGGSLLGGQALLSVGLPAGLTGLRRQLASGHEAVVLLLGDSPQERMLLERPDLLHEQPLSWPAPPANAYVDAAQLLCAASELPLRGEEVAAWQAQGLVERLEAHERLVRLPGPDASWQPLAAAGDPYLGFSMLAAGSPAATLNDERGQFLAPLDPAGFDRWAFVGASVPPFHGGLRVTRRNEESLTATVRPAPGGRHAYPLRRCTATMRDEREQRPLDGGQPSGWGRVLLEEQVYAFREATPDGPRDTPLAEPLITQWAAPAWWIELPAPLRVEGQLAGWCLAAAVPLQALCQLGDLVPCYDQATRRLYLVEAQPGGNGLASWLFANADLLLPLAYDVALACRNEPLIEPLGRIESDWLLPILGRQPLPATTPTTPADKPLLLDLSRRPERDPRPETRDPRPEKSPEPPLPRRPARPPVEPPHPIDHFQPKALPPEEVIVPSLPTRQAAEEPDDDLFAPALPAEEPDDDLFAPPLVAPVVPPPQQQPPARQGQPPLPARKERRPAQDNGRNAAQPRRNPEQRQPARPSEPPRRPNQPPQAPPQPPQAPREAEPAPDAAAMIARMRRMREEREAATPRQQPPARPRTSGDEGPVEPRFAAGERVFCLPFGDGEVRRSTVVDGREILVVAFPQHGEIEIDPAVSLVRRLDQPHEPEPDE